MLRVISLDDAKLTPCKWLRPCRNITSQSGLVCRLAYARRHTSGDREVLRREEISSRPIESIAKIAQSRQDILSSVQFPVQGGRNNAYWGSISSTARTPSGAQTIQ